MRADRRIAQGWRRLADCAAQTGDLELAHYAHFRASEPSPRIRNNAQECVVTLVKTPGRA